MFESLRAHHKNQRLASDHQRNLSIQRSNLGGHLGGFLTFWPSPRRSGVFYNGKVGGYKDTQNPILHLTSSVEAVKEAGLPFAFTDGHAEMAISDFLTIQTDWIRSIGTS